MIEEYLSLAAILALSVATTAALALAFAQASTPTVCVAAKTALAAPGSELLAYGRFRVYYNQTHVYLTCGLWIPKNKVLYIEKTEGLLTIGSTATGQLYIR